MSPRFVIVEDDHLQKGPLEANLQAAFAGAQITTFISEHQFSENIHTLQNSPPDLILMDVMLRWTIPSPNSPAPPAEVAEGGYYRAGLRCANLLLANERLREVPVVLYTILEQADLERDGNRLPANCSYVGKSGDIEVLLRKARALIGKGASR